MSDRINVPSSDTPPEIERSHVAGIGLWESIARQTGAQMQAWGNFFSSMHKRHTDAAIDALAPTDSSEGLQLYKILKHYIPADMMRDLPPAVRFMLEVSGMSLPRLNVFFEQDWVLDAVEAWAKTIPGHGKLYEEPYNHQFLAEDVNGNIVPVDPEDIISLFQATPRNGWQKPTAYPHILFTSSHANGESLKDVTKITHGIEAVGRESWDKKPLNLAHIGAPIQPGQTLILYSCETEKNPILNGIALTRRLKELKARLRDGKPDQFRHISPGAQRIAALMTACMSENYYQDDGKGGAKPLFPILEPVRWREHFKPSSPRIDVSADAGRISQHMSIFGYSKGGNVAKDTMRYLDSEWQTEVTPSRGLVRMLWEEGYRRGITQLGDFGLRSIFHNINVGVVYAREVPLSDRHIAHGINCVAFNNRHDPLTMLWDFAGRKNDEFYSIDGISDERAHAPELSLGDRTNRGTVLNDSRVERRMKEWFAPHHGRAALANILFDNGNVWLEAAPGTPDAMVERYGKEITGAMKEAGLTDPRLANTHAHMGLFEICTREHLGHDVGALEALGRAFTSLKERVRGLMVAQSIIDSDIPERIDMMHGIAKRRDDKSILPQQGKAPGK